MSEISKRFLRKFADSEMAEWSPHRKYISVQRQQIVDAARFLFREIGCRFSTCTGSDTRDGFEILYHFSLDATGAIYSLRTLIPKDDLKIDSITPVVPAANWIEREMKELLGIEFTGHPNPAPLLTSDVEWDPQEHPLRRDYDRECHVKPKPWEKP
jgi:NADH:ubiquinone oxidoreductase subunit C